MRLSIHLLLTKGPDSQKKKQGTHLTLVHSNPTEMFSVTVANETHFEHIELICKTIKESAKERGTGIAERSPEDLQQKMRDGNAIIAIHRDGTWAGFCYIGPWSDGTFVSNSALIVAPEFRRSGLARKIKEEAFKLAREKFSQAKLFGLTTSEAVKKVNKELGYHEVPYSAITPDNKFWEGCKSCVNYPTLMQNERKTCRCTAMIFDPQEKKDSTI